jgi:hypothetical protein
MKTFTVRLNVPALMWCVAQVEAENEQDAQQKALEQARDFDYEFAGFDPADAEIADVQEEVYSGMNAEDIDRLLRHSADL